MAEARDLAERHLAQDRGRAAGACALPRVPIRCKGMRRAIWRGLPWLAVALLFTACASDGVEVELRGHTFVVEVADDHEERMRGLMFRDTLPANAGMLFIFEREEPQAFWMKNTRIPLDILYFDRHWTLVAWSLNTPPCALGDRCPSYPSQAPARYVLELNAGTSERIGARLGDRLTVRGLPGH